MKKMMTLFLSVVLLWSGCVPVHTAQTDVLAEILADTAACIHQKVLFPQVGSVGGEWAVLGLARSEEDIAPTYFQTYYQTVENYVKECSGNLHNRKYTEFSRVVLALTAIGKSPEDVGGYNLLVPLGDYEKTVWQGVNGAIWALLALDSGNYDIPENAGAKIQATRDMYLRHILERQTEDGGWALAGDTADVDITAMALCALGGYLNRSDVQVAVHKALARLSEMQMQNGGFTSNKTENSESSAWVLCALCTLGIRVEDARFVKNGKTVVDHLLTFYVPKQGFAHEMDGAVNPMATEQCFYALVAFERACNNKTALFDMSDVSPNDTRPLLCRYAGVKKIKFLHKDDFTPILGQRVKNVAEALASGCVMDAETGENIVPDVSVPSTQIIGFLRALFPYKNHL